MRNVLLSAAQPRSGTLAPNEASDVYALGCLVCWLTAGHYPLRAKDLADARRIAEADPMHASGARSFKVRPWLINEGTITIKVSLV